MVRPSRLRISLTDGASPVEWFPGGSPEEAETIFRAVYRQLLGSDMMQSERLAGPESLFQHGQLTVREFVRAVAQSELYRSRFFETSPPYRFIEMNYKHLLGRAPQDQAEISEHVQLYTSQGYEAEINAYIDSEEYVNNFGDNVVPYYPRYSHPNGR